MAAMSLCRGLAGRRLGEMYVTQVEVRLGESVSAKLGPAFVVGAWIAYMLA